MSGKPASEEGVQTPGAAESAPEAPTGEATAAERIAAALEGVPHSFAPHRTARDGTPVVIAEREALRAVLERLRGRGGFETNSFVTAVDRFPAEPRYELNYQFLSVAHNDRVRVKCCVGAEDAVVPTCIDLWPGAAFAERECYDMFGVRFEGHGDLKRLLMPEGYGHHPLRKDFPHEGIEPDRLYREWDRERRKESAGRAGGTS